MKNTIVRLILFCLALAMLGTFSACNHDDGDDLPAAETTAAPDVTEAPPQPLVLAQGGVSEYVIVRPDVTDQAVIDAGAALYNAFVQAGIKITLITDWEKPGTDPATRPTKEILIGATNRTESDNARTALRYDEYSIALDGEKVVICGGGAESTAAACAVFMETCMSASAEGNLELARDINLRQSAEYPITALTLGGNDIRTYTIAYTDSKYESAAQGLQRELISVCGWALPVKSVSKAEGNVIMVGMPKNAEEIQPCSGKYILSGEMLAGLSAMHAIEHKDGKLILAGNSAWTAKDAVADFSAHYLQGKTGEVDIGEIGMTGELMTTTPVYADADLRVMTLNTFGTNGDYAARFPYLIELVQRYLPDVIGMQEVNKTTHNSVLNQMTDVYTVAAKWHEGGSIVNYTPILYRKDKYELVEADVFFLRSRYTGSNTKSISWAVLSPFDGSSDFIVINLHGALIMDSYNLPGTNSVEGAAWRVDNVKEMIELMETVRAKYGDLPTFFTADYNFNSGSEAYETAIKAGLIDTERSATVSRVTGIKTHHDVGVMPASGKSIDRVFVTEDIVAYVHNIVTDEDALKATDHCAVYIDAKITP